MKMALDGPNVIVDTSSMTSAGAAIIVQTSCISSLPLPKLSHAEMTKRMDKLAWKILRVSLKTSVAMSHRVLCAFTQGEGGGLVWDLEGF
jgi:hypothetical protein